MRTTDLLAAALLSALVRCAATAAAPDPRATASPVTEPTPDAAVRPAAITTTAGGPAPRANATLTALPAAGALLLLGGEDPATGALFDDAWRLDARTLAWTRLPYGVARAGHTAVWTGREVVVFGGRGPAGVIADALRIDGESLAPSPLGAAGEGAPGARVGHSSVWTGREVLVYGGRDADGAVLADAALYDPARGAWRAASGRGAPMARSECGLAWTGEEAVVWGGANDDAMPGDLGAAAYDPARDAWRALPREGAPAPAAGAVAAWSGREVVVSSREGLFAYDPRAGRWREAGPAAARGAALVAHPGGVAVVGGHGAPEGSPVAWLDGALGAPAPAPLAGAMSPREDPLVASDGASVFALFGRAGRSIPPDGARFSPR